MLICPRCHLEVESAAIACAGGHTAPFWNVPGETVHDWVLRARLGSAGKTASLFRASRGSEVAAIRFIGPGEELEEGLLRRYRAEPGVQNVLSRESDFVRLLSVLEEPQALVMEMVDWPTLRRLIQGFGQGQGQVKKLDRIAAVSVVRRIARAIQKLHDCELVHGGLAADGVFVDPASLEIKVAQLLLVQKGTVGSELRARSAPPPSRAVDIRAIGNILVELLATQSPPAGPLHSGEPELDALSAECLRAMPLEHLTCTRIEGTLRTWEERAELQLHELLATTAKLKLELAPWVQIQKRLDDIDLEGPDPKDPTTSEMGRRQGIAVELAAAVEAERARHARAVAPVADRAAAAVVAAPGPPPARARAWVFVLGLLAGAGAIGLVSLSGVAGRGEAPPRAKLSLETGPGMARDAGAPDKDARITVVPVPARSLAAAGVPIASATPDAAAGPDLAGSFVSPCPAGMRLVPGGVVSGSTTLVAFCMDATEVTLSAYEACVAEGKCKRHHKSCEEDGFFGTSPEECDCTRRENEKQNPVNCLSASLAATYCATRGKELPTKDQWQWAVRGAQPDGRLPWGKTWMPKRACLGRGETCPVMAFPDGASPQGIYDLVGNVAEWTRDRSANGANFRDGDSPGLDPASRERIDTNMWSDSIGFRCVRPL